MYTLHVPSSPNSCVLNLQGLSLRSLIDTGSELTLINKKIYDTLSNKPKVQRNHISLHSANGSKMSVLGSVTLDFKIKGVKFTHNFLVVSDLSRNVILGRDFLVKNNQ